jgi:hypothetical protein
LADVAKATLSCRFDKVFAVIQTSTGAFGSIETAGISFIAREHPQFEFTVATAIVRAHMSRAASHPTSALSTTIVCKDDSTLQPLIHLLFESKRFKQDAVTPALGNTSISSMIVASELGLASFLGWKDSKSRALFEKEVRPDFCEFAVFTVVGSVRGARLFLNLDELLRVTFLRSLVHDCLQLSSCLQEAAFTSEATLFCPLVPITLFAPAFFDIPS